MSTKIHTAMVLAAGFGVRMRPLTLSTPKPLLEVGGQPMLDSVIDRLVEYGIKRVVVNAHYMADQIAAHVKKRQDCEIILSHEDEILDTGGGIKKALPHLGSDPVFVVNSDLPWQEGKQPALQRLAQSFDTNKMDALLLLADLHSKRTHGFNGAKGDFLQKKDTEIYRAGTEPPRPYVFISVQILKPAMFKDVKETVFSNNQIWDSCEKAGRLHGLVHDGACYHVGTPEDLVESNRLLETGAGW
jgi:MurNAc alpha-1-phosphate uridylyltransferase